MIFVAVVVFSFALLAVGGQAAEMLVALWRRRDLPPFSWWPLGFLILSILVLGCSK